ncbi:RNA polymerase subunit sigma-24 [Paenibacillus faecis]|uniref:RNA polymerase sigma factor n=1 Tax=Paenibacillus faecis TaxID=862114 RepID=UPI001B05BF23|nr:sigma-70 family RNA polymerase sigma factor [Paenibacillus faecis]GIO85634.1 RNA polymerase subunit sigma-24 [Paenibacillus faecis]
MTFLDRLSNKYRTDLEQIEMLVRRTKIGDKEAFTEIIRHFEKPMYIYCYHMLRSREEAEDALQEIFIKAYEQIEQYHPKVSFSAWVYKIAYHYCLNQVRGKKRWYKFLDRYKHVQCHSQQNESTLLINDLMRLLTTEEKHIVLLRTIYCYSFNEISEMMSLKPATVRKKYERIRKKLLAEKLDEGGTHLEAFSKSN